MARQTKGALMDYDIVFEYGGWHVYIYLAHGHSVILGPFDTERDASLAIHDRLADTAEYTER